MHELSLAASILDLVEQTRLRDPFDHVTRLHLLAGALSGVEISALRFALEAIAPGTCLEQAQFDIDEEAASAWCLPCGKSLSLRSRLDSCPICGNFQLQPTGGTELKVLDLLVV